MIKTIKFYEQELNCFPLNQVKKVNDGDQQQQKKENKISTITELKDKPVDDLRKQLRKLNNTFPKEVRPLTGTEISHMRKEDLVYTIPATEKVLGDFLEERRNKAIFKEVLQEEEKREETKKTDLVFIAFMIIGFILMIVLGAAAADREIFKGLLAVGMTGFISGMVSFIDTIKGGF